MCSLIVVTRWFYLTWIPCVLMSWAWSFFWLALFDRFCPNRFWEVYKCSALYVDHTLLCFILICFDQIHFEHWCATIGYVLVEAMAGIIILIPYLRISWIDVTTWQGIKLVSPGLASGKYAPWDSFQIRKIVGCACAGNAGNVFPATDFKGNR